MQSLFWAHDLDFINCRYYTFIGDEEQCFGGRRRPFPTMISGESDFDQVILCSFVSAVDEGTLNCAGQLDMLRSSFLGVCHFCISR